MSPIEILENLISRLNNLFTVQTQEVIPELNKIKELLEQKPQEKSVVIVAEKDISNELVEEVKQEPTEAIMNEETIESIRARYTEKFQKKPFAWWSKEVLLSKIQ